MILSKSPITDRYQAAERFVDWLADRVVDDATGATARELHVDPCGLFWLGRLAPEAEIADSKLGERAERLEPCAVGMRLAPQAGFGETVSMQLRCGFVIWERQSDRWSKSNRILVDFQVGVELELGKKTRLQDKIQSAIDAQYPSSSLSASVEIEVLENRAGAPELAITLVNRSLPNQEQKNKFARARIFESELFVSHLPVTSFVLESLPDSFRYDRRVPAWGINCGVVLEDDVFRTVDLPRHSKQRPQFWNAKGQNEDFFSFERLANDPIGPGLALVEGLEAWGAEAWDMAQIRARHSDWSDEMEEEAQTERAEFENEVKRIEGGIKRLQSDAELRRAFQLMNRSMLISARDGKGGYKYTSWRPFQIGFLYANLDGCRNESTEVVDIVWFTTGGGKTETYLGLILTAAFLVF